MRTREGFGCCDGLQELLAAQCEVEPVYLCLYHTQTCATCILEHKVEQVLAQLLIHPMNLHEPLCAFASFGNMEPVMILLTVWRHMESRGRKVFYNRGIWDLLGMKDAREMSITIIILTNCCTCRDNNNI